MGIDARIGFNGPNLSSEELLEFSWQICRSIGSEKFFIDIDGKYGTPSPAITKTKGDNPLYEVHVWTRYYGEGYERGDLLTLCGIAEWLETNIPGCEVWYGGDSQESLLPWPESERTKLRQHLYSKQGRAYFEDSWAKRDEYGLPEPCALCPSGIYQGHRFGAGGNYASFNCGGCGRSTETHDGGKTWKDREKP